MSSGRNHPEQSQWPAEFEEYLNMNPGKISSETAKKEKLLLGGITSYGVRSSCQDFANH